jgi:zinc/manganese transport system substrate-binding protein
MKSRRFTEAVAAAAIAISVATANGEPLHVCATLPDLGSVAEFIGGDQVEVTTFGKGGEDPHFIEARPSFVKSLSHADLFIQQGLELEVGWAPVLQKQARNPKVLPGAEGDLDAAAAINPLEKPTGPVDRSMGDVHRAGNPHYMLDPMNGLIVAAEVRDRLGELRPGAKAEFAKNYERFRQTLAEKMVGKELAAKYDIEKLALLYKLGKIDAFLAQTNQADKLGGWLGQLRADYGVEVVDDHAAWSYLASAFGLKVVEHLEPKPGITPTSRHLADVIELMKKRNVRLILSTAYFDPRHAQFVAEKTGAKIAELAHQTGGRPGTDDYLSMLDYNVTHLAAALGGGVGR